jgi:hypothetical protein
MTYFTFVPKSFTCLEMESHFAGEEGFVFLSMRHIRHFARVYPHWSRIQVRIFVLYGHHSRYAVTVLNGQYLCSTDTGHLSIPASAAHYALTYFTIPKRHLSHLDSRWPLMLSVHASPCPVACALGFRRFWMALPVSCITLLRNRTRGACGN